MIISIKAIILLIWVMPLYITVYFQYYDHTFLVPKDSSYKNVVKTENDENDNFPSVSPSMTQYVF